MTLAGERAGRSRDLTLPSTSSKALAWQLKPGSVRAQ